MPLSCHVSVKWLQSAYPYNSVLDQPYAVWIPKDAWIIDRDFQRSAGFTPKYLIENVFFYLEKKVLSIFAECIQERCASFSFLLADARSIGSSQIRVFSAFALLKRVMVVLLV